MSDESDDLHIYTRANKYFMENNGTMRKNLQPKELNKNPSQGLFIIKLLVGFAREEAKNTNQKK